MNTFRELLEDAKKQVETYRNPQIEEFVLQVEQIAVAMGTLHTTLFNINVDRILDLGDKVLIEYFRGRTNSLPGTIEIPNSIVDADRPLEAARIYGAKLAVGRARDLVEMNEESLIAAKTKLKDAEAHLRTLQHES